MTDRVVALTGATGTVGPAVARAFADAGDRVAAIGRHPDRLADLIASLAGGPSRHRALPFDVTRPDGAAQAAAAVATALGPASILVHAVGGYRGGTGLVDAPADDLDEMLDVHVRTTDRVLRAFLPAIRTAAGGRIVTFSVVFAQAPIASNAAYSAAKAGLEALTLSVGRELATTDATANVLVIRAVGSEKRTQTTPVEIAGTVMWLCSPAAAAVNAQRISMLGRA